MSRVLDRCPACAHGIRPDAERCGACGQVWGEANLCERCHGLCGAVVRGVRLECSACRAVREAAPGLVIEEEAQSAEYQRRRRLRAWSWLGAAIATGLVSVALAFGPARHAQSTWLRTAATIISAAGFALALWAALGYRLRKLRVDRFERFHLEQRVVGLAYQRHGVLRAAEVAAALDIPTASAEHVLSDLSKQGRAHLEVASDAQLFYVFRDAKPTRGIRLRNKDATGPQLLRGDDTDKI